MAGSSSSKVRRRGAAALGLVAIVLLLLAPAGAQVPSLVHYSVVPSNPVDDASGPAPDTTTPRYVTLTPDVSALDVDAIDGIAALLPAQIVVRTQSPSGPRRINRLLTPLTDPNLLTNDPEGADAAVAQPAGRQVVQRLAADVSAATAQAYLLDPNLGLVAAGPAIPLLHDVTAEVRGGQGTVTADPARLACSSSCTAPFVTGDLVTLTATATDSAAFVFDRWEGCDPGPGANQCTVVASTSRRAVAHFAPAPEDPVDPVFFPLRVSVTGESDGLVTSTDGLIRCPPTCTATEREGTTVTLQAEGGLEHDWSGICQGRAATCVVVMNGERSVGAHFTRAPEGTFPLAVDLVASRPGDRVTSRPAGIDCPGTCRAFFAEGVTVDLLVEPAGLRGHRFLRWAGACVGRETSCAIELDGERQATARFVNKPLAPKPPVDPPRPPGEQFVKDDVPGCAVSRSCPETFTEIAANVPAWPELLLGVLLLLFIAFPTALVDATIQDNYKAVADGTRRLVGLRGAASERWKARGRLGTVGVVLGYAAAVSLVYWVADPPPIHRTLAVAAWFGGATLAFVATTMAGELPKAHRWRRAGHRGGYRDSVAYLGLAIFSAAASRAFHLDPGYTFGVVAGYASFRDGTDDLEADANQYGAVAGLGLAVAAMAIWTIAREQGLDTIGHAGGVFVTTLLSVTIAAGFSRAAFTYLPFDFFEGSYLARRRHRWWWAIWGWAILVAAATVLTGHGEGIRTDVFEEPRTAYLAAIVAVGVGCLSWLFWDHWRAVRNGTPRSLALVITR